MSHNRSVRFAAVVMLVTGVQLLHPGRADAQGGNVDIIAGRVTDQNGHPVANASIDALSIETDVTRHATSNAKGDYIIFFNDGGGEYRVTARAIGHNPFIQNVSRQPDDDRISLDINLGAQPVQLQDLVSNASRRPNLAANDRPTAGETSLFISGEQAMRLPIDASDLASLAALAPGVIFTEGTDSTSSTFSVAGQSAESNNYQINGATTSSTSVPQDAVRTTRVITNSYDVSRGGFAGGQVSVTTKGGSNRVSGSFSSRFQNPDLSWGGYTSSPFGNGSTIEQLGGGYGGPLKRNKTFLFGSLQVRRNLTPLPSLDEANDATLVRLGLSPDSVSRFLGVVNGFGYNALVPSAVANRSQYQYQSINRFDWNLGQSHIVTITANLSRNTQDPSRIASTQLQQVGGNTTSNSAGLTFQIASRFGRWVNQFRGSGTFGNSQSDGYLNVPAGRVTTESTLDSGAVATNVLGFGGNGSFPQHSSNTTFEATNELAVLPGRATHRFTLGLYALGQYFNQDVTSNRYGTFSYNSLADFATNMPSQFTRTLQPTVRNGGAWTEALYLSDAWRPRSNRPARTAAADSARGGGRGGFGGGGGGGGRGGRGGGRGGGGGFAIPGGSNFQLIYGVRLEHSSYVGAPALNDSVYHEFGLRTDELPSEWYLSPRVGFTYSIPRPEQQGSSQRGFAAPLVVFRGGAGVFRGTMPATLAGTAEAQSGLSTAQTQLVCVGGAVPIPDWQDYATNPGDIPSECINDLSTPVLTARPTVTVYDPNYGAPKTKRLSLGVQRSLTQRITFTVDGSYVRGVGQAASQDLNLADKTARFTLASEDNRPVYADPAQIIPGTGAVPLSASRIDPAFGTVTRVFSTLQNDTRQVTFNVAGTTNKQIILNLAYTLMYARDEGGEGGRFGGGSNQTAGDPNVYTWAPSSNERRHNFQLSVQWPITPAFELSSVGSISSGTHYTPIVAGDINGDGSGRDDRAFIYAPATAPDTAIANGMTRLLNQTSGNARKCLEAQMGEIAGRNSCTGPWQPRLDFQLNWRPNFFARRLSISLQTINTLGGLDELINGDNNLKGWGGNARPDNALLTVNGFDPATDRFTYVVNDRFGNTSSAATAVRRPFQLGINVRYAIGYDQRTLQIQGLGRNVTPATARQLVDSFMVRFSRQNAALAALARTDSLALTPTQVRQLEAVRDSAAAVVKPQIDSLTLEVAAVQKASTSANPVPLLTRIRELSQEQTALSNRVRTILTDVQWALLPAEIRTPTAGRGGFGGGRGGRGGRGGGGGGDAEQ
jgi:hypothetical protein